MTILLPGHLPTSNFGAPIVATAYKFNSNVRLYSIGTYATSAVSQTVRVMVWDANGNYLGGSNNSTAVQSVTLNAPVWHTLTTPLNLVAGTTYFIGQYISNNTYSVYRNATGEHAEPTVDGVFATSQVATTGGTKTATSYYHNTDTGTVFPSYSSGSNWEFVFAFDVTTNTPPTATALTPNYEARDNRTSPVRFSWTHTDEDSDPQNAYQIQYRVKDSGGAWTTVSGTTNTYHDFAAGTFTHNQEYEWQLRVSDAVSGYSAWSDTKYFTSGIDVWKYGTETTSSTQSGTISELWLPPTYSDFSATDSVSNVLLGWTSTQFFSAYTLSTVTRNATAGKGGTPCLEVTWPAVIETNKTRANLRPQTGFVIGAWYEIEAEIYVPAGSPNVRVDPFLQTYPALDILQKDQWVKVSIPFQATSYTVYPAIVNIGPVAAGTKMYVDNFQVKSLDLEPGTYEIQVRTADAEGFGPWSTSQTFTVTNNPKPSGIDLNPKRIGGNVNVTWTYTDAESNPQTKYQVRYK